MIVVDTSALMAIILQEPDAQRCIAVLDREDQLLISAGTVTECLIVAAGREAEADMRQIIDQLGFEIISVTSAAALQMGSIYRRWGKGHHPAKLNMGDCFAYQLANERDLPLLYIGDDFARTDIRSALPITG